MTCAHMSTGQTRDAVRKEYDMEIPKKMKAVVLHAPHDARLEIVDVPELEVGDVLLKVEACGICAADAKAYAGGKLFWGEDTTWSVPTAGGHEIVGTIVKMAPGANDRETYGVADGDLAVGDRVAVEQIVPCGKCRYCRNGHYSHCVKHYVFGQHTDLWGGFAEYVKLPREALLYKIPKKLPVERAVVIEPFSCSMNAIRRAQIQSGDIVVISGAGCLGLGMLSIASTLKPKHLIALDLNDKRLGQAKSFGADITINPGKEDVYARIGELTEGYGCDVYIEATGYPSSVIQGLKLMRKGGNYVEFSLFMDETTVNWSVVGDEKELNIYGVSLSPRCYPEVIEGIASGKFKTEGVVTHQFALDDFQEALDTSCSGANSIKVAFVNRP